MSNNINKSHYCGIVAEWYDIILESEKNDIIFYKDIIKRFGGPALELASGTGRILTELLKEGVIVDGIDFSSEMNEICKRKIKEINLSSEIYEQDFAELKLPKKYNTIFIAGGSFQLISNRIDAQTALGKIHDHLLDSGVLILDLFTPLEKNNLLNDGVWVKGREGYNNKREKLLVYVSNKNNLYEQTINGLYKYELYQNGRLNETVIGEIILRWYGQYEFLLMLEKAGFSRIQIERKKIISTHGEAFVYIAHK
ncbi:MAG: methyltransferase domain-containing protein [Ignavibacteria bacterium]|jgi:ubiquinone/menaquinone biosynthesis C-methylase UbiE